MRNIFSAHRQSLAERAIDTIVATNNGIHSVSASDATSHLQMRVYGDCIAIPYRDLEGLTITGDDGVDYVRYRVFDNRSDADLLGDSVQRYLSRPGSGSRLYIPAAFAAQAPLADFVVLTEGEFKAVSATSAGIPTVAISGVTSWSATPGTGLSDDTPVNQHIVESLKAAGAAGVLVLADSDAKTNKQVRDALRHLAAALTRELQVPCYYARVNPKKSNGTAVKADEKFGLDDWIALSGASEVREYLKFIWRVENEKAAVLATNGYIPLGIHGELNYVWSVPRECLVTMTAGDIASPGKIINLVGGLSWCEAAYGDMDNKGKISVNYQRLGGELVSSCIQKGFFDAKNMRGTGVWRTETGALVVNGAEGLFRVDGEMIERFGTDYVYQKGRRVGITPTDAPGTAADARLMLDALSTWTFKQKSDATLLLGWLHIAFLAGALRWRPHVWITAPKGSGKSTIEEFLCNVQGPVSMKFDAKTSEAGARQNTQMDALSLFIDEAEAANKMDKILEMLRASSSGSQMHKGTQDQKGVSYSLNSIAMLCGINPPVFNEADESRYVKIELLKRPEVQAGITPEKHSLLENEQAARELGKRLFSRALDSWDRLQAVTKIMRRMVTATERFLDTYVQTAAAAWVALNDGIPSTAEAQTFIDGLNLQPHVARIDSNDANDPLDTLLSRIIQAQVGERSIRVPVGDLIGHALHESRNATSQRLGPYGRALGALGMRVNPTWGGQLLIDARNIELKKVFDNTELASADLLLILKRHTLASTTATDPVTIGSKTVRPVVLNISQLPVSANDAVFTPPALPAAADLA